MTPALNILAPKTNPEQRMMALDPGATTGWSLWLGNERTALGQNEISTIEWFLDNYELDLLVFENYRIYPGREKVQRNLYTPRLIGRIEAYAELHHIPVVKQMAAVAKRFCNDQKLKDWQLYQVGQPHSNDATRHGCYFLIFGQNK